MISVLYGTESGNAEMVAEEITDALGAVGLDATTHEMCDITTNDLAATALAIVITSTYGEGELPASAAPLVAALGTDRPDLSGLRFAAFGLGDSSYDTYNNGVDLLAASLLNLGAEQLGTTGRHDAASGTSPTDEAVAWATHLADALHPAHAL